MLKIFGYGDKFRDQAVGGTRQDIELLAKDDYRTAWDMNRPLENIYEGVETLNDFMELFGKHILTDEGVFKESLHHEFSIANSNVVRVDLINRIPVVPTHTFKTYTTLAPGIAGVYHDASRQESMIVIHKPNVRLFERQISELLGLFYHDAKETVEVKYSELNNTMKMRVKVRPHPSEEITTIEFGGDWEEDFDLGVSSIEMITEMYNDPTLNHRFVDAIDDNIELLMMEPMFEITQVGTHYWEINNGLIQLSQGVPVAEAFRIGKFDIDVIADAIATDIVQEHRQYGESFRTDIHGEADNSVEVNTLGGIEYNMAKGFKLINDAGAIIEVSEIGDITINTAPGRNMDFGGVNVLGITANVINLTSVLNQDGTTNIDATGVGEEFNTDAETHNVTAETQNNIVTDKVDTVTSEERIVGTKTEVVSVTDTQTVIGKKTLNANNEYEVNTPLLDINATTKTSNSTTETNTIGTQNNIIDNVNDTIITKVSDVTTETNNVITENNNVTTQNNDITNENNTVETKVSGVTTETNTIGTQNNIIDNVNDTIITKVSGITTETNNVITENNNVTTQNNDITNENNTVDTKIDGITTETRTINTKTETINNTDTQTVVGKKTLNANEEYEINTPLLDVNATAKTQNSTTDTNVITTQTNTITTKDDTIGTKNKEVTGNETEVVGGNTVETVTGDRSTTSKIQNITGVESVVISAPSITLDAGENGIINIIGEQQVIEGTTVQLEDNIIELNKNQTGTPVETLKSGFEVNRGDEDNASLLFREEDDTFGVGVGTDIQTIQRKELNSVSVDNGIPSLDTTTETQKTDSKFTHNRSTGVTTMNTTGVTVAPIITNSTKMNENLNADMVDGVDVVSSGAAANELAMWTGGTTIGTSNKYVVTSINGESDAEIPTEAAVSKYVNARFVLDGSFSIANTTKGVSISYTDGDANSQTFAMTNIDVDTVDGTHINKTGAAANEIAMWTGTTTIGTANKTFVTTISGESDSQIPTEAAVSKYVNARFVLDGSISLSLASKGVKITYTDGDANSTSSTIANVDADTVDGVHLDNTGAANGEIAVWNGTTGIKTANRSISDSVGANSNVPDGQAIIDYFNYMIKKGTSTFAGAGSYKTIAHGLAANPTSVQITAHSNPGGYLGEVWATWDATNIYVYCSGSTTTATFSYTVFR